MGRVSDDAPEREPERPRVPSICLAKHPLAGVTCTELYGHDGPHGTTTGVRMTWDDPEDPRSR